MTASQPSIQQRIARTNAHIDRLMQPFADRLAEDAEILDGDWEINVPADDSDLEGKTSKSAERTRERRALARMAALSEPIPANDNAVDGLTGQSVAHESGRKIDMLRDTFTPPTQGALTAKRMLNFVDPSAWQGKPVPVRKWYVPALIPSRTVTLLSGDGGLGKSLLALQLAIASALGGGTMGLQPQACRVVYVGAEDEEDEFQRRTLDILKTMGKSLADLEGRFLLLPLAEEDATLTLPDRSGTMVTTPLMTSLVERIAEFEPGLVVLDTSADLYGGDEIKRPQVRQFVAMLRKIALGVDCAVLLLSHPSVSGMEKGTGTSGSTAWNNSVRSRLYLTPATGEGEDPDGRLLTNMKNNYGKKGEALSLRWEEGVFVRSDGAKPSAVMGVLNERDDELFLAILAKMNRDGQNVGTSTGTTYAPTQMSRHPDGKGTTKEAFKRAMHRLLDAEVIRVVEFGPPSHRRKRLWVSAEDFGA